MYLDVVDLNGVLTWRQEQRARLSSVEAVAPCAAPTRRFSCDDAGMTNAHDPSPAGIRSLCFLLPQAQSDA